MVHPTITVRALPNDSHGASTGDEDDHHEEVVGGTSAAAATHHHRSNRIIILQTEAGAESKCYLGQRPVAFASFSYIHVPRRGNP